MDKGALKELNRRPRRERMESCQTLLLNTEDENLAMLLLQTTPLHHAWIAELPDLSPHKWTRSLNTSNLPDRIKHDWEMRRNPPLVVCNSFKGTALRDLRWKLPNGLSVSPSGWTKYKRSLASQSTDRKQTHRSQQSPLFSMSSALNWSCSQKTSQNQPDHNRPWPQFYQRLFGGPPPPPDPPYEREGGGDGRRAG